MPFQDGRLTDGAVNTIPGIGTVRTAVDNSNYTLTNFTTSNHLFKDGSVTLPLTITDSVISVRTFGTGTNTNRFTQGANYMAAPYFKGLDANIRLDIGVQQLRNDFNNFFD